MKIKYLALGLLALSSIGFVSCKNDKGNSDDKEYPEEEYKPAPVLTERQKEVSDSVFKSILKENTMDSVITTKSGLRYVVIKEGEGKSPTATDQVKVHYTGKLPDGSVFDSSVERGEPITFGLGNVIRGWTEGLQLMKEGGKTIFYIPSSLAYGPNGQGPIGPNQDLVFEVELIQVNP